MNYRLGQVCGHGKINAICPLKKSDSHILIASDDQYVLYDLKSQAIIEVIASKKKSQQIPTLIDVSHDDLFSIEASLNAVTLRSLKSKQALAKYEGHQHSVSSLSFASSSYVFITAAGNECLLWNPRELIKSASSLTVAITEISQPDKMLDLASSDQIT